MFKNPEKKYELEVMVNMVFALWGGCSMILLSATLDNPILIWVGIVLGGLLMVVGCLYFALQYLLVEERVFQAGMKKGYESPIQDPEYQPLPGLQALMDRKRTTPTGKWSDFSDEEKRQWTQVGE